MWWCTCTVKIWSFLFWCKILHKIIMENVHYSASTAQQLSSRGSEKSCTWDLRQCNHSCVFPGPRPQISLTLWKALWFNVPQRPPARSSLAFSAPFSPVYVGGPPGLNSYHRHWNLKGLAIIFPSPRVSVCCREESQCECYSEGLLIRWWESLL